MKQFRKTDSAARTWIPFGLILVMCLRFGGTQGLGQHVHISVCVVAICCDHQGNYVTPFEWEPEVRGRPGLLLEPNMEVASPDRLPSASERVPGSLLDIYHMGSLWRVPFFR